MTAPAQTCKNRRQLIKRSKNEWNNSTGQRECLVTQLSSILFVSASNVIDFCAFVTLDSLNRSILIRTHHFSEPITFDCIVFCIQLRARMLTRCYSSLWRWCFLRESAIFFLSLVSHFRCLTIHATCIIPRYKSQTLQNDCFIVLETVRLIRSHN